MEVILLERVARLGNLGETVTVKDGYARNYLLPQGKALRSNKANLAKFEADRSELEARNLAQKSDAEGQAILLDGKSFITIRQASDAGQLYGSVSTRDIAALLKETGVEVTRTQVHLSAPIKALGLCEVTIALHPEVGSTIIVNVARSEDEAELQARGEDVTQRDDDLDDDEGLDAEEVFEDADLAAEAEAELAEDDAADEETQEASPATEEPEEPASNDDESSDETTD
jgi:large subunit ribosomal protein L9